MPDEREDEDDGKEKTEGNYKEATSLNDDGDTNSDEVDDKEEGENSNDQ